MHVEQGGQRYHGGGHGTIGIVIKGENEECPPAFVSCILLTACSRDNGVDAKKTKKTRIANHDVRRCRTTDSGVKGRGRRWITVSDEMSLSFLLGKVQGKEATQVGGLPCSGCASSHNQPHF